MTSASCCWFNFDLFQKMCSNCARACLYTTHTAGTASQPASQRWMLWIIRRCACQKYIDALILYIQLYIAAYVCVCVSYIHRPSPPSRIFSLFSFHPFPVFSFFLHHLLPFPFTSLPTLISTSLRHYVYAPAAPAPAPPVYTRRRRNGGTQIEKDVSDSHPLASVYIYNSFSFSLLGI